MAKRLALINGRIFTSLDVSGKYIEAEGILIEDNKIVATGHTAEILEMIGEPAKGIWVLDLKGRTAIPGLIDSHNHVLSTAALIEGVDCFGAKSIAELKQRVAEKAKDTEPGQWITGGGWIESQFIEKRAPTRHDLDEAAPDNPVCITRLFGASAANSSALRAAGIGEGFLPQAGRVDLDTSGRPTGIVREAAQGLLTRIIETSIKGPAHEELERKIVLALKELLKYGITSVLDPGVSGNLMRAYASLRSKKMLPLRLTAMPTWHGKSVISGDYEVNPIIEAGMQPGLGDSWFRVGNLKMAIDGGLGAKTAMMHGPYKDWSRSTLPARVDLNKLGTYIHEGHMAGWGTGIHCCGDLAQDFAVAHIVDAISEKPPLAHQRHHIIHGYFPTEYALKMMAEHDLAISLQPGFIHVEGDIYPEVLQKARLSKFKPAKTYLARGIKAAINTDVSSGPINPFVTIYGAVARKTLGGLDFGQEEALTSREAIQCFTKGGAYLAYRDTECGVLAPGFYADLAILDHDVLDGNPEDLLRAKIIATILDGKFVYLEKDTLEIPRELIDFRM